MPVLFLFWAFPCVHARNSVWWPFHITCLGVSLIAVCFNSTCVVYFDIWPYMDNRCLWRFVFKADDTLCIYWSPLGCGFHAYFCCVTYNLSERFSAHSYRCASVALPSAFPVREILGKGFIMLAVACKAKISRPWYYLRACLCVPNLTCQCLETKFFSIMCHPHSASLILSWVSKVAREIVSPFLLMFCNGKSQAVAYKYYLGNE